MGITATAGLLAAGLSEAAAAGVVAVGGTALTGAAVGAGVGAAGSAISGGDPLKGALTGAVTGGLTGGLGSAFGGAGGALTSALGSQTAANALIGAGSGALGSAVTGKDPVIGALYGGAGGAAAGMAGAFDASGQLAVTPPLGESIVPPIPPSLDAAGNPIGSSTGGTLSGAGEAGALSGVNAQSANVAKNIGSDSTSSLKSIFSNPTLLLGALSAVSSMGNKPQQGTYPLPGPSSVTANLGPLYNASLQTNAPGRTAVTPSVPNYYTYGSVPGGVTYFQGNTLRNYGFAEGGAANENGEFMTDPYGSNRVDGPGGPKDDLVPAALSNGEYVLTAKEVSDISGKSNSAGADKLDRLRKTGALSQVLRRIAA